ncbi:AAA family ATPase [Pseudooceanicola nitratireducens]|nr:AAA family ATPase [Pseudooceanicola nitratireducens]
MVLFHIIDRKDRIPSSAKNEVFLRIDYWNDYSFVTMFQVLAFDENGTSHDLESVKIGFKGQTTEESTHSKLDNQFETLPKGFFSLGVSVEYYNVLGNVVSSQFRDEYLSAIRDIVSSERHLEAARGEDVFKTSLLRSAKMSSINEQFKRVLEGGAPTTDFDFRFTRPETETFAGVDLKFSVKEGSLPSTNIHALIGRNGVGKTTILNDMTEAVVDREKTPARFLETGIFNHDRQIRDDFFSSLVSVSFSAFDPFDPPEDRADPETGVSYFYVGLKDNKTEKRGRHKELSDLRREILAGLESCFSESGKKRRWLEAIATLESDRNFSEMKLPELSDIPQETKQEATDFRRKTLRRLKKMSTGHSIVLLTITKLVDSVIEKTLVLIDEPETHLHPPLLSAFTRALSELLHNRNGVAIIATHSPVVLQEVPKSCVWKVTRSRLSLSSIRPEIETFGENVGVLTREVFGLEVTKSGFHTVLEKAVESGDSYDEILRDFRGRLGFEAKGLLRAMVANRESIGDE